MIAALSSERVREIHGRMRAAAGTLRLPLRHRTWKGASGNWQGVGIGSSIDFQDHRPYLPGDDPRYIDWQAYARTGAYTMKLYRDEVSPRVDLLIDCSASMWLDEEKTQRVLELFYFCLESTLICGGAPACIGLDGARAAALPMPAVMADRPAWPPPGAEPAPGTPALERAPLRHGALRVWISDLLFPSAPEPLLQHLVRARGRGLLLAPFSAAEEAPPWNGNMELIDCETDARRRQRVDAGVQRRYRAAYARHFELWTATARKYGVPLARVPAGVAFLDALREYALPAGAVESCN